MRIPATLTLPILTYILCSSISGKNLMFNKTTHSHINIVTRVKELRTYHVDVRINTYFKDGRYDGATAVYHKHVPIGLVLDILDVSTLKKAHIHKRFIGCGNTYRLDGTRLIPTSLDKEYVTNAN